MNEEVLRYFDSVGQPYFVSKVYSGDYIDFKAPRVAIDLKKDLLELANNLTSDHERFKREIARVRVEMQCDFVVLIREPFSSLEQVQEWSSSKTKVKGTTLYKTMKTMSERYGVIWRFCTRENAGEKILKILMWYSTNK